MDAQLPAAIPAPTPCKNWRLEHATAVLDNESAGCVAIDGVSLDKWTGSEWAALLVDNRVIDDSFPSWHVRDWV